MDPLRITGTQGEAKASAERDSPRDLSARWLRELERAGWTIRASPVPLGATTVSRDDSTPQVARLSGTARGPDTPYQWTARAAAAPQSEAGAASEPAPGAAPSPRGNPVEAGEPLGGAAEEILPADDRAGTSDEGRLPVAPKRLESTPWPRANLYVYRNESEVDIWVRDATLDPAARVRLAGELRAGLGVAGLRLGTLVVNGEVVLAVAAVADGSDHRH
jgi:hypothetical protein